MYGMKGGGKEEEFRLMTFVVAWIDSSRELELQKKRNLVFSIKKSAGTSTFAVSYGCFLDALYLDRPVKLL